MCFTFDLIILRKKIQTSLGWGVQNTNYIFMIVSIYILIYISYNRYTQHYFLQEKGTFAYEWQNINTCLNEIIKYDSLMFIFYYLQLAKLI